MESGDATRTRIMDAAERLFADQGIDGTSLRQVIARARVNIAAIHYHFGSKDALIEEVVIRRMKPLNAERLRLLEGFESRAGTRGASIERILEAFLAPAFRMSREPKQGGDCFVRLMGRLYGDPSALIQRLIVTRFRDFFDRFVGAMKHALPGVGDTEFFWRIHFTIGAMGYSLCDRDRARVISNGLCDPDDVEIVISQLVAFLAAGLRAGRPKTTNRRAKK